MALPFAVGIAGRIIAKNKASRMALNKARKKVSGAFKNAVKGAVPAGLGFAAGRATAPKPKKPTMSVYERRMRETHKKYGIKAKIGRGQK